MGREKGPWVIDGGLWDQCRWRLFPMWLKDRGGVVVYRNQNFDSSEFGRLAFMPANYIAVEDGRLHPAPDEWRPDDGLPSRRCRRVALVTAGDGDDVDDVVTAAFAPRSEEP